MRSSRSWSFLHWKSVHILQLRIFLRNNQNSSQWMNRPVSFLRWNRFNTLCIRCWVGSLFTIDLCWFDSKIFLELCRILIQLTYQKYIFLRVPYCMKSLFISFLVRWNLTENSATLKIKLGSVIRLNNLEMELLKWIHWSDVLSRQHLFKKFDW